ncbi:MAG: alpha/beta fold hydrolase [bacterium]
MRPQRPRLTAREQRWLASAVPFRLEVAGRRLAAWSWGDGPTVLLLHGWSGRGSQLGGFVAPLLAAGFSVVTYDNVAHGDSPGRWTNLLEFRRVLLETTHKLFGLHAIVAHSLGCFAAALAMQQQLPVSQLVFLSPPAELAFLSRQFCAGCGFTPEVHDRMCRQFEQQFDLRWADFHVDRFVRNQHRPLLVVHDVDDQQVPLAHGARVAAAWPAAQLLTTTDLGHHRIVSDAVVIQRIVSFLADSAASPGSSSESGSLSDVTRPYGIAAACR